VKLGVVVQELQFFQIRVHVVLLERCNLPLRLRARDYYLAGRDSNVSEAQ
jgi:hypothetical protein